jgi:hypothetical protein
MTKKQFLILLLIIVVGNLVADCESTVFPVVWNGWWHQYLHDNIRFINGFILGSFVTYSVVLAKCRQMIEESDKKLEEAQRKVQVEIEKVKKQIRQPKIKIGEPSLN